MRYSGNEGRGRTSIGVNPAHLLDVHRRVPLNLVERGFFSIGHDWKVRRSFI